MLDLFITFLVYKFDRIKLMKKAFVDIFNESYLPWSIPEIT